MIGERIFPLFPLSFPILRSSFVPEDRPSIRFAEFRASDKKRVIRERERAGEPRRETTTGGVDFRSRYVGTKSVTSLVGAGEDENTSAVTRIDSPFAYTLMHARWL